MVGIKWLYITVVKCRLCSLVRTVSGGSAVKKVISRSENPPARSPGCIFSSKKLTTFFKLSPSKHRPPTPFHRQNKTNKAVRYGNICIFCSHYYRSKAIRRARQGFSQGGGLPARSFDLAHPGVAPPLRAVYIF